MQVPDQAPKTERRNEKRKRQGKEKAPGRTNEVQGVEELITKPSIAVISGNGFDSYLKETSVDTQIHAFYKSHGIQKDRKFLAKDCKINSSHILFINRYSIGNIQGKSKSSPHEIDYKSMFVGLYQNGVDKIISLNMCGSLQKEMPPGSITLIHDFIDFVNRDLTLDDLGLEIADMTIPFDQYISSLIKQTAKKEKIKLYDSIYVSLVDGSRLETPAEISFLRSITKESLVAGMEVATEAQLAKLLNIRYAAIGVVTNYATGLRQGKITQNSIEGSFDKSVSLVKNLLFGTITRLANKNP